MHDNLGDPDEDDDDDFDVHSDHQETPSNEGENVTDE
jgi:hypothetical protein